MFLFVVVNIHQQSVRRADTVTANLAAAVTDSRGAGFKNEAMIIASSDTGFTAAQQGR